jgi:glycosyltransferase involved in cell wall biosynthesis
MISVLINAFACGPNWGSEVGMGWHWVVSLSEYCQLTVITEKGFQKDIEEKLPKMDLKFVPKFHYINIGENARKLFWKQGSFRFYHYYKKWQKEAYQLAIKLIEKDKYNIIHQLNMIGFREPGYLWKIKNIPFIWGPVGGYNQFPWTYFSMLNFKNKLFYLIKNIINEIQKILLYRPRESAKRANALFAATIESKKSLIKISKNTPIILNETGCNSIALVKTDKKDEEFLQILWVGKLIGLKALPIALYTLSKIKLKVKFKFIIVGDGPDERYCKKLAQRLGINEYCDWIGKITNDQVIHLMRKCGFLFFTSLKEGTPHVITEAIENGLPVLCHDSCGHGVVVTKECGVKISMKNFNNSILEFSKAIINFANNPSLLDSLSKGALKRANEITWDSKARFMFNKYQEIKAIDV